MGQPVKSPPSGQATRSLFGSQVRFVRGVTRMSDLPECSRPEIAICGRSNVGKSSLINALVRRKALARISKTPGRTRQFNYFDLADRMYLVDLPGIGYARASDTDKRNWADLSAGYFSTRASLMRCMVLIDVRRGLGPLDMQLLDMLDAVAVPSRLVLTKIDTVSADVCADMLTATGNAASGHSAVLTAPIPTSARTGQGIEDLRRDIVSLISSADPRT